MPRKTTAIRISIEIRNALMAKAKEITHSPKPSANVALYALLGRIKELEKLVQAKA